MSHSHSARADSTPDASAASSVHRLINQTRLCLAKYSLQLVSGVAIIAIGWLAFALSGASSARLHWAANVVLPAAIVLLICVVSARHEMHWRRPLRSLKQVIRLIRLGERPIEELTDLQAGGLAPLIPILEELLHENRRQNLELNTLHDEIRQRVANRTDALERAMGSLRAAATRDPLSGLCNRRMLDISLPKIIDHCRATRSELAVLMIDVDHFKNINDTLGHAAGDDLLRDIGQLIRSTIRTQDMAFRPGGDEFVVLMPGADAAAAASLGDRLSSLVDGRTKTMKISPKPRLSIGCALLSDTPDNLPETLLALADKRLYEVKGERKRSAGPAPAVKPAA